MDEDGHDADNSKHGGSQRQGLALPLSKLPYPSADVHLHHHRDGEVVRPARHAAYDVRVRDLVLLPQRAERVQGVEGGDLDQERLGLAPLPQLHKSQHGVIDRRERYVAREAHADQDSRDVAPFPD